MMRITRGATRKPYQMNQRTFLVAVASAALGFSAYAQNPVPPPPEWLPVIECAAPVYSVERLICGDPALLAADRRMEAAYARAARRAPKAELSADQQAWSKQRNLCVFKRKMERCVRRLQARRIRQLEVLGG